MQNFGKINETFKNILVDSIISKSKKGKKLFKIYSDALKENAILKSQYQIYSKLENKVESDTPVFVDECISILQNLGVDKINEANGKLFKLLSKNGYEVSEDTYQFKDLHNHITKLIFLNRNSKNLNNIIESKVFITKFINENPIDKNSLNTPVYKNRVLGPNITARFNEKYSELNEDDKKILRLITSKSNSIKKKELYESTIWECIDLVNNKLVECTIEEKDKLLRAKEKLLKYKFNEEEFISEIIKINRLKTILI